MTTQTQAPHFPWVAVNRNVNKADIAFVLISVLLWAFSIFLAGKYVGHTISAGDLSYSLGTIFFLWTVCATLNALLKDRLIARHLGKIFMLHDGRLARFTGRDGDRLFFRTDDLHKTWFELSEGAYLAEIALKSGAAEHKASKDALLVNDTLRLFEKEISRFHSCMPLSMMAGMAAFMFFKITTVATIHEAWALTFALAFLALAASFFSTAVVSLIAANFGLWNNLWGRALEIFGERLKFEPYIALSAKIALETHEGAKILFERQNNQIVQARSLYEEIVNEIQKVKAGIQKRNKARD